MRRLAFYVQKYLFLLILILGIFLRIIYLGSVPGGYHRDEAYAAWNAFALFHEGIDSSGHSYPVYFEAWAHGQSALYTYLMLPLIGLAGGQVTSLVVRIPQVVVSIATLIAVYFLLRKIFTQSVAIWGMFLLAINPWHVMMSRWGLDANLAPGLLIFGLLFFLKGMEKSPFYLLSALFYGLSLYSYAVIWLVVPVMLLLQFLFGIRHKKIWVDKWSVLALFLLFFLALPLLLFLLVNMGVIPEFKIGCFSIYRMSDFRSGELAGSLREIWENIRYTAYFLKHQNIGQPYDVIMPYGLFYISGRFLLLIGIPVLLIRTVRAMTARRFTYEWFVVVQLIGAGMIGSLVSVSVHKINILYIPLIICQVIGLDSLSGIGVFLQKYYSEKAWRICRWGAVLLVIGVYLGQLVGFQVTYYTDYKELVSAYFQEGSEEAVRFAMAEAAERDMDVEVNEGLKYPNVLLAAEIKPKEYLDTLIYSEYKPAPSEFSGHGVTFYMGIDYENISNDRIYVLYFTDLEYFQDYKLTAYHEWYAAVPIKIN